MITARQSRAARALLGWTQETLADKATVALTALKRLESNSGLEVFESTRDQVRRALESAGIVFLTTDKGEGENIFAVQGSPADPGHLRTHVDARAALRVPVEESFRQLEALRQQPGDAQQARQPTLDPPQQAMPGYTR